MMEKAEKTSKKLYFKIYDEICDYIQENDLNPGDKLPTEAELMQMFGVGRSALREAIKALEITGVISSHPGIGITICKPRSELSFSGLMAQFNQADEEEIGACIEETRRILELGLARRAFDTIDAQQIELLSAQVEIMRRLRMNTGDPDCTVALLRADAKFHSLLFQKAENRLISAILDLFWAHDRYFRYKLEPMHIDKTVENHVRILDALKARNSEKFYEAMFLHFVKTGK